MNIRIIIAILTCWYLGAWLDGQVDLARQDSVFNAGTLGILLDSTPSFLAAVCIPLPLMWLYKEPLKSLLCFSLGLIIYELMQYNLVEGVFDIGDLVATAIGTGLCFLLYVLIERTRSYLTLRPANHE